MKPLTKEMIDGCFQGQSHQANVLLSLWEIAIPEWDDVREIKGYPVVSDATGRYIGQKFIEFDHKHHKGVLAGGAWMNKGFSTRKNVPDWIIDLSYCEVVME